MTSYLYTTAYPYALKKPVGPFYCLRVRSMGCLDVDGVIARIDRLPFVIPPEEYAYLVNTFLNECIAATAEGFHIATPQMRWALSIRGTVGPSDLWRTFAPGRLPAALSVAFRLTPGPAARQATTQIGLKVCGEATPKAQGSKMGGGKGAGSKGNSAEGIAFAPGASESTAPKGGP